ncbi:MAG: Maf family protein [Candidatus Acidulodesulfobacterium sp.]
MDPMYVLASSSQRRISLLKKIRFNFIAVNHNIADEPKFEDLKLKENISIENFVKQLAFMKAKSIAANYKNSYIIGADTVIFFNGKAYGKPLNLEDAFNMLKKFEGKTHEVYSGISIICPDNYVNKDIVLTDYDKTLVSVKPLSDNEINSYIYDHPPFDRAGSYGIQDENGVVESYSGSFENVLGLPVQKLLQILKEHNLPLFF